MERKRTIHILAITAVNGETFDLPEGKAYLEKWGLGETYKGVGYCILGYAEGEVPAPKPRKETYIIRP